MNKKQYKAKYHPGYFDTEDAETEHMTDEEFEMFFELLNHEKNILEKNPYSNSRECKFGILRDEGFRTMAFHSKLPKVNTGDMRIVFQVNEEEKTIFYFAVGKRINERPRPESDIYSKSEQMLKDFKASNE